MVSHFSLLNLIPAVDGGALTPLRWVFSKALSKYERVVSFYKLQKGMRHTPI
jgi:hypothetical protein